MQPYVTHQNLAEKTEEWLRTIEAFNVHRLRLKTKKAALLVIDMQDYFLEEGSPAFICGGVAVLPGLKRLIAGFRKAGRPVIYTRHVHHPDGIDAGIMEWWWQGMCVEGAPESEIHASIAPLKREKVVLKHRYSAFFDTDLETVLRCCNIEDLVISGVMTNMCCESTTRDAYFRDYRTFFLADGTGTINEEMHVATLLNVAYGFSRVTTVREIERALG
ncbi:MAG: cysteine hydrolase [Candidatus Eiseniibacteriota bacterium]|nr:MAG: cysteine hydrolase [Candidatus Eisenbacteria bacterium]